MLRLTLFVITTLSFFILTSCNSSVEKSPPREQMEFAVDTALTDLKLFDSATGLSYRVPAGWQDLMADYLAGTASRKADSLPVRMIRVAGDMANQVFLSLLDIRMMPDSHYRQLKINYNQLLNRQQNWNQVTAAEFYKDSLLVYQYVMSNTSQTLFRLIFFEKGLPLVQLDFRVPNSAGSPKFTKILESVIGSFETSRKLAP